MFSKSAFFALGVFRKDSTVELSTFLGVVIRGVAALVRLLGVIRGGRTEGDGATSPEGLRCRFGVAACVGGMLVVYDNINKMQIPLSECLTNQYDVEKDNYSMETCFLFSCWLLVFNPSIPTA